MSPYRPNRKTRRSKKYKKIMSEDKAQEPGLGLNDLVAIVKIIDVASERGAFKGAELSSVGAVRDKVAAFVDSQTPKEEKEENATSETAEGAEATEETSE